MKKNKKSSLGQDQKLTPNTLRAAEYLVPGTLHAGEDLDVGTLHAGEDLDVGTLHAGEDLDVGTLHAGEDLDVGTLHAGEDLDVGTLHAGEDLDVGTLHASEDLVPSTLDPASNSFPVNPFGVKKVFFSTKAFGMMKESIGREIPENGGALFGYEETLRSPYPFITEFVLDAHANTTHASYTINTDFLNPVIHVLWDNFSLELQGLVHSHPYGLCRPSTPDMDYFRNMFIKMKRPYVITPIIHSVAEGSFKFFCYLVGPDKKAPAYRVEYAIIDEKDYEKAVAELENIDTEAPNEGEVSAPDTPLTSQLDPGTLHAGEDIDLEACPAWLRDALSDVHSDDNDPVQPSAGDIHGMWIGDIVKDAKDFDDAMQRFHQMVEESINNDKAIATGIPNEGENLDSHI